MDFNLNSFTSPTDQYHVNPYYMPYVINGELVRPDGSTTNRFDTTNRFNSTDQSAEGFKSNYSLYGIPGTAGMLKTPGILGMRNNNRREGMTVGAAQFLGNINEALKSSWQGEPTTQIPRHEYTSDYNYLGLNTKDNSLASLNLVSPTYSSDLAILNNSPNYANDRTVGRFIPDYSLNQQIMQEINRINSGAVTQPRLSNANFNPVENKYVFAFSEPEAQRILYYNSGGRAKGLEATPLELAYGVGKGSAQTNFQGSMPFIDGDEYRGGKLPPQFKKKLEGFSNQQNTANLNEQNNQASNQADNRADNQSPKKIFSDNLLLFLVIILSFICYLQCSKIERVLNKVETNNTANPTAQNSAPNSLSST